MAYDGPGSRKDALLYLDSPTDREPGLLTTDDRAYLLGEKHIDGAGETQLRQRLRDRIRNGLLDFEVLIRLLGDQEISIIGSDISEYAVPGEKPGTYFGAQFTVAFLYYLVTEHSSRSFESLVEDGVEMGAGRTDRAFQDDAQWRADATVNIDIDWQVEQPDLEGALGKLRDGQPLSDREIASLVRDADLTDSDWERLHDLPNYE
jgi:hypothetical protein